jgi:hypothetical protein
MSGRGYGDPKRVAETGDLAGQAITTSRVADHGVPHPMHENRQKKASRPAGLQRLWRGSARSAWLSCRIRRLWRPFITNTSLFQCQGRAVRRRVFGLGTRVLVTRAGPLSRRGDYRLPGSRVKDALGRRCAAGLRPVLDLAARSRAMAAAREREQWGSWGGWRAREWLARRAGGRGVSRPPWMQSGAPVALPGSSPRRLRPRWASAWRQAKMASLICRFRQRRASFGVLPSSPGGASNPGTTPSSRPYRIIDASASRCGTTKSSTRGSPARTRWSWTSRSSTALRSLALANSAFSPARLPAM